MRARSDTRFTTLPFCHAAKPAARIGTRTTAVKMGKKKMLEAINII